VFTNIDTGVKITKILLEGRERSETFTFALPLPGPVFLGVSVKLVSLYPGDKVKAVDLAILRHSLEALPCCTTDATGTKNGAPLNLAIVESRSGLYHPLLDQGWHLTERLDFHSMLETVESFCV